MLVCLESSEVRSLILGATEAAHVRANLYIVQKVVTVSAAEPTKRRRRPGV